MEAPQHGPHDDEPTRSSGSTVLTLGLLNIGISLYAGTSDYKAPTARSQFIEADDGFHAIGSWPYDKALSVTADGLAPNEAAKAGVEPVIVPVLHKDAIIKGRDLGDGTVVTISDAELSSFGLDKGVSPMTIVRRPTGEAARWLVAKAIYQARPTPITSGKKKSPNPVANALYAALLRALAERDCVAVFPLLLKDSGAGHYGMLDCHGRVTLLQYSNYLRAELPLPDADDSDTEQMCQLLDKHVVDELPALIDTRAAIMEDLVEQKLSGRHIEPLAAQTETHGGTASDLLRAALEAS